MIIIDDIKLFYLVLHAMYNNYVYIFINYMYHITEFGVFGTLIIKFQSKSI